MLPRRQWKLVMLSLFVPLAVLACGDDESGGGDADTRVDAETAQPDAETAEPETTEPDAETVEPDGGDEVGDDVEVVVPVQIVVDSRFGTVPDTVGDGVQGFLDTLENVSVLRVELADPSNGSGILNAVDAGEVDMGIDLLPTERSGIPELDAVLALYGESVPFGMDVDDYLEWLTAGGGLELLRGYLVDFGYHPSLRIVPVVANAAQGAGMFKMELTRERFDNGFLMRTFGAGQPSVAAAYPNMTFIGAVGGSVGNIVAGFASELEGENCPDGVGPCELMGAEFFTPCVDRNLLYDQRIADSGVRYYYTTPWQSPASISFLMYRSDRFSEADNAAIEAAARANIAESRSQLASKQQQCLADLAQSYGQEIRSLPPAVLEDLRGGWHTVRDQMVAANERVAEVLGHMEAFAAARVEHRAPVVLDSRFAPAPDTLGDGVEEFVDTLRGVGAFEVELAAAGNGAGILNAVNAGDVDLGIDNLVLQNTGIPELNAVLALYGESVPFGIDVDDYLAWLTAGGGLELLRTYLVEEFDYHPALRLVPVVANVSQAAGMFKVEATRESFDNGFLMRTFGSGQPSVAAAYPNMTFIGAVGGSVGNIVDGFGGELAGENCPDGVGPCELMAAEFVAACVDRNLIYSQGIADTGVQYYYTTPWQSPATILFLMYRADRFSSAEIAAIEAAALANVAESRPRLALRQGECLADLEQTYGQEIRTLPPAVLEDLRAGWHTVRAEMVAGNDRVAEVVASMDAFAAAQAESREPVILDARFAPAPDTLGDGVQEFIDTLQGISALDVELAGASNGAGILNAVDAGEVDLGIDVLSLQNSGISELNSVLALYGESVPFGLDVDRYLAWMTAGGGFELLRSYLVEDFGYHPSLRIVPLIANTSQAAGMFKVEVTRESLEAGFLMRTFGNGQPSIAAAYPNMTFIGAVGGSVGNIVAGFAAALEGENCPDGVGPCELSGAEFLNPCIDSNLLYSQGIADEGVQYYYTTPWQSPATIFVLMYRSDRFSAAEVAAIEAAARANIAESGPRLAVRQQQCLTELEQDYGQEIRTLPPEVLDDLRAGWAIVRESLAAADARVAEVLESMESFAAAVAD